MSAIRPCREDERSAILSIVKAAAEAYRGVIPDDRWHEPYMDSRELDAEIAAGVEFWGYDADGELIGAMGIQPVRDVDLIRHAYVLPGSQRRGVGSALLEHLRGRTDRRILVGTWAAADWAIRFYERHGFELASPRLKDTLLRTYWTIPDRQIETSVVLADPPFRASARTWDDARDSGRVAAVESENVAAVRAMVELISRGELEDLLDRFAAEDIELDYTRSLSPDQAGIFRGTDEIRRFWHATREPWQELEVVGDEYIEVGDDTVVVSSHTRQVGRESGIEVVARGAMLFRLRDGELVRWQLFQSKAEALEAGARHVGSEPPHMC